MISGLGQLGRDRALALFADWTDRIAAGRGAAGAAAAARASSATSSSPSGTGRIPKAYLHDEVSTDRRNPTRQRQRADLRRAGAERRLPASPRSDEEHDQSGAADCPRSEYAGHAADDDSAVAILGQRGRLDQQEQRAQPDARRARARLDHVGRARPSTTRISARRVRRHPSAKLFPIARSSRHLAMYDPKTKKLTHISTCFGTHHLMFAEDANNTLWTSGGGQVVGWLNTKMFEETGDEAKSQGWTALVIDTNGNGKRDAYVEPNEPVDPAKDKRYGAAFYAVAPAPDGSIWGSVLGFPGAVVRLVPGSNPPETTLAEVYEPPFANDKAMIQGFSPRGGDVDRNGVYWSALASGHMASFDRRKCKGPLNGPTATGQHCPEGWTLYAEPLPQLKGVTDNGSAEGSYYTWVDQFDTSGLGANTPIDTGNASEGLLALKDGKWVVLRVPYPTGFYTKWMDGRIDDPKGGLEGQGTLDDDQHARPVPHGDGEGHDEQSDQVPDAT